MTEWGGGWDGGGWDGGGGPLWGLHTSVRCHALGFLERRPCLKDITMDVLHNCLSSWVLSALGVSCCEKDGLGLRRAAMHEVNFPVDELGTGAQR